jgi:hypothetical protein
MQIARTQSLSDSNSDNLNSITTSRIVWKYILNIAVRRSHCIRSDTNDISNDLFGPAKLSDDLLICQSREGRG